MSITRERRPLKFTGSTRFFAFALLVTTATAYMSSCKDDIFLPDPRGLLGDYSGVLIVEDLLVDPPTTDTDHVSFSLRGGVDSSYQHQHQLPYNTCHTPTDS